MVTQILKADRELEFAYTVARTSTSRAELTLPSRAEAGGYPSVTPALDVAPKPDPVMTDHELFERHADRLLPQPQPPAMAFTRALGRKVHLLEESGQVGHVSVMRLLELLAPVLHTERTEETASDDDWVRAVANLDSEAL